ncbi:hypothetical protein ACLI1A_13265 [Flavobacterium sp. RHBU_3]|uniref:hypothetical protein n=1 Tax=Flavobacterium sp. RHBU_3 TaxID=3391184 RepID=UPI0039846947
MIVICILLILILVRFVISPPEKKQVKFANNSTESGEYIPFYIEDDYLQIELVPKQNTDFIKNQMDEIKTFSQNHFDGVGYTDIHVRENIHVETKSLELRTDYVTAVLERHGFKRAVKINYQGSIHPVTSSLPFGFPNFTIFVDTCDDEELVKVIWLCVYGLIMHVWQREAITNALYDLGTSTDLVLADWNSLELYDLSDKKDIDRFLQDYWK